MAGQCLLHGRYLGHLQRQHLQRVGQSNRLYGDRLESDDHVTVDVGLQRLLGLFVGFIKLFELVQLFELVRFFEFLLGLFGQHLLRGLEFDRRLHRRWNGQCRHDQLRRGLLDAG